jgi:hypothetical protein
MTPGAGTVAVWDPSAGERNEQTDAFLVIGNVRGESLRYLHCFPTLQEAEDFARTQDDGLNNDNTFVVPAKLACLFRKQFSLKALMSCVRQLLLCDH